MILSSFIISAVAIYLVAASPTWPVEHMDIHTTCSTSGDEKGSTSDSEADDFEPGSVCYVGDCGDGRPPATLRLRSGVGRRGTIGSLLQGLDVTERKAMLHVLRECLRPRWFCIPRSMGQVVQNTPEAVRRRLHLMMQLHFDIVRHHVTVTEFREAMEAWY